MTLPERLKRLAEYQDMPGFKKIMEDAAPELDTARSENFSLNHKLAGEVRVANKLREALADAPHDYFQRCELNNRMIREGPADEELVECECWKDSL